MNSWATPDGVVAFVAIVTLAGTVFGAYFGLAMSGIRNDIKAKDEAQKEKNKNLEDRINGLVRGKEALESRLLTLERDTITRSELEKVQAGILTAVEQIGDRMSKNMETLSAKVDHFMERLAKVEALN